MDALPRQVAGDREVAAGAARALTAVLADLRRIEMRPPEDETAAHVGSGDVFRLRWSPTLGRVDRLSRQLLAYAGRQSLVPEALGLTSFLSNLANALRSTLDVGIELFVDIGDDCLQCYVDASALEEALLTLVVNGRDAMPSGGRLQLTATAETVSNGSKGVALSICDSGHGMPDEFMMRAKRPFVTSKTYDPWAGMGLAAADGFARQSDGRLTLRARTGGGVCATLHLPQFPHVGTAPQLLTPDHQEESQRLSHELAQLEHDFVDMGASQLVDTQPCDDGASQTVAAGGE